MIVMFLFAKIPSKMYYSVQVSTEKDEFHLIHKLQTHPNINGTIGLSKHVHFGFVIDDLVIFKLTLVTFLLLLKAVNLPYL